MNTSTFLPLALLFAVSLHGQSRPGRFLSSADGKQPTRVPDSVSVNDAGRVKIWASDLSVASFATGVAVTGAYEVVGQTYITDVLVAGRDSSGGRVEHWVLDINDLTWSLASSWTLPGADFTGVAFDGARLYLLDCISSTILRASWATTQSLAQLSPAVYLTAAQVPELAAAKYEFLFALQASDAPALPGSGIFLVHQMDMMGSGDAGILISEVQGVTTKQPCVFDPFPGTTYPVADETSVYDGGTTLVVETSGPSSFEVLDPQGFSIGSGSGPTQGGPVQVSLSQPLVIGNKYSVRQVGTTNNAPFYCLRRQGFPEAFADNSSLTRMVLSPADYRVGNQSFTMTSMAIRSGFAGSRIQYDGLMIIGLEGAPIVPIDNGQGVNQFLVSEYWVGAQGFIAANASAGFVDMVFPIPNDPSLEGVVVLGQFAIADGALFRLSEVIGFKIKSVQ